MLCILTWEMTEMSNRFLLNDVRPNGLLLPIKTCPEMPEMCQDGFLVHSNKFRISIYWKVAAIKRMTCWVQIKDLCQNTSVWAKSLRSKSQRSDDQKYLSALCTHSFTVKVLALQKSLATVTDLILYMTLLDYQWCIGV